MWIRNESKLLRLQLSTSLQCTLLSMALLEFVEQMLVPLMLYCLWSDSFLSPVGLFSCYSADEKKIGKCFQNLSWLSSECSNQFLITADVLYCDQLQILSESGTAIIWSILSCNCSYRCLEKLFFNILV